jgi:hypothetical protein
VATKVAKPPALRCMSCISARGGSQESKVAHAGPERYHPSQMRNATLSVRRFITQEAYTRAVATARLVPMRSSLGDAVMKSRVGEQGLLIPKELLEGFEEVEITKEDHVNSNWPQSGARRFKAVVGKRQRRVKGKKQWLVISGQRRTINQELDLSGLRVCVETRRFEPNVSRKGTDLSVPKTMPLETRPSGPEG